MNTFARFLKVTTVRNWEVWPLYGFLGIWAVGFSIIAYKSFCKPEIWLDRSKKLPPWDWTRCREIYYKTHQKIFFAGGKAEKEFKHSRIPILENLQDELIEAAKERVHLSNT